MKSGLTNEIIAFCLRMNCKGYNLWRSKLKTTFSFFFFERGRVKNIQTFQEENSWDYRL